MSAASMFRSPADRARYFAAYDATLARWPVPVESFDVPTRAGSTHVHAAGPVGAPPLLLLPGQAISSTMWYPNIGALSQRLRVYAPDTLGDLGKSVSHEPITRPDQFVDWLSELLDALELERVDVAGLSMGGHLALRLALSRPERVHKLVLMSPASLLPFRARFFLRMALMVLPSFVLPLESKQRYLLGTGSPAALPAIQQMLASAGFRYTMVLPPVFTAAELQQVRAPTLLLLGDHEVVYDHQAALKRAQALIPGVQVTVIPEAGHALNFDQPELVNRCLLEFLDPPGR
jgi:pimeloyl-ACP methyl ester carboxylesterase